MRRRDGRTHKHRGLRLEDHGVIPSTKSLEDPIQSPVARQTTLGATQYQQLVQTTTSRRERTRSSLTIALRSHNHNIMMKRVYQLSKSLYLIIDSALPDSVHEEPPFFIAQSIQEHPLPTTMIPPPRPVMRLRIIFQSLPVWKPTQRYHEFSHNMRLSHQLTKAYQCVCQ